MEKYYYQQEFCETTGYRSLNPIVYEEIAGEWKKKQCTCNTVCSRQTTCKTFLTAPEKLEKEKLRDKML